ncbi:sulfite exporter TauE/SafE family protein [Paracraurococcus lichenis]|uniref:Probable membrane transporter protein n=1 Tax=Paracraurococcus lichenis TaxID=3064888 RepID=A0ABT9DTM4_9PROT|nr:sulfite exporter TauE/SafE family protein [Paracraurococcus sp. LOR1-02]MDO9707247.1 sulfite exporter TauE/SafE family protein [Paracraurococcus sp. LOR1-02]
MDPLIPVVALGAAAGGFVQGLSGFAFGLVAQAIWAWTLDPVLAGPLTVFGSLVGQMLAIGTIRRGFEARRALPFILGGVLGVPLGVLLLPRIDPGGFRIAVGLLLVVWCPAMLLARDLPRIERGGRLADGAAGMLGGIMGGLGGLTGPAPTLWVTLRGWGRDAQRSVFQAFNLAMHALTMAAYLASGTVTPRAASLFLVVAPAMLLPALLGARLYRRFSDIAFQRLVLGLLAATGLVLLATALLR